MSANPTGTEAARPPALLPRVRNYALALGGLCALVGAIEGAVVGTLLSPHNTPGALTAAVAFDRGILLGLAGAAFGAVIPLAERYLSFGRKRAS